MSFLRKDNVPPSPPSGIRKQGFLIKKGPSSFNQSKKRWFVLNNQTLRYYTDDSVLFSFLLKISSYNSKLTKMKGSIDLDEYTNCELILDEKKPAIKIFNIEKPNLRSYHFYSENQDEAKDWVKVIATILNVYLTIFF